MRPTVVLKNFRAFDDSSPVRWSLPDGFVGFVGANNSGKSSLLRFFHEARPSLQIASSLSPQEGQNAVQGLQQVAFQSVADNEEVFCNRNDREMSATFELPDRPTGSDDPIAALDERHEPSSVRLTWTRPGPQLHLSCEFQGQLVEDARANGTSGIVGSVAGESIELSLLRYQHLFLDLVNSIYLGPFRNAINVGGESAYYDLEIGQRFIEKWAQLKTGSRRANNRAAIRVEQELRQIFNLQDLALNTVHGDAALHIVVDGQPYQLGEHGAGLAQFIVVMAFAATKSPAYIFIDEPELNLHPALQLDFMTTLARYSRRGVAFATHSIGLARAIGQDVHSVRRHADGRREVRPLQATDNLAEFLGELSLSGYQELGFRRVLLVEGATEVPALQQLLRLYGCEHNVVILPLGGSSLINGNSEQMLNEIRRITTDVFVLIDSERNAANASLDGPREEFMAACNRLGFVAHALERRAFENYLTDAAVKEVKGPKYRALEPYESLTDVDHGWAKAENWRIAGEMTRDDIHGTDLGAFLLDLSERPAQ